MHFRQAELWEVGTYLLVQHQTDQPICNALDFQMKYLETFKDVKDKAEQESANWQADDRHQLSYPDLASGMTANRIGADEEPRANNETVADSAFFDNLDALWHQGQGNIDVEESLQDFFDGNDEDEVEHALEDNYGFQPYLPNPGRADPPHCRLPKNVDFAFLQALKNTRVDPEQGVMLIYDIVCQYIIHRLFIERSGQSCGL